MYIDLMALDYQRYQYMTTIQFSFQEPTKYNNNSIIYN